MDTQPQIITPPPVTVSPTPPQDKDTNQFDPRYIIIPFVLVLIMGLVLVAGMKLLPGKSGNTAKISTPAPTSSSVSDTERKVFPTAKQASSQTSSVAVPDSPDQINTGNVDQEMADLQKDLQSL